MDNWQKINDFRRVSPSMSDDAMVSPNDASGYFMLAHRDTALAHDTTRLLEYKAAVIHGLLFNNSLSLADHMIVNSPNFRLAFHKDRAFQDIICSDVVRVVHFDKFSNGPHLTLRRLRQFYADLESPQNRVFHPNLGAQFRTADLDPELDRIQDDALHRFPHSELRDPRFTEFVVECMDRDFLEKDLGTMYPSYRSAYDNFAQHIAGLNYQTFGIINFDSEHSSKSDLSIFDFWAETHGAKKDGSTREGLIRRYGRTISRVHRALLVRAETEVMGSRIILPRDLRDYRRLVLPASDSPKFQEGNYDEQAFDMTLDTTAAVLAYLSINQIRECRKMGEDYFALLQEIDRVKSTQQVAHALKQYIYRLNRYLSSLPFRDETGILSKGFVRVVYGALMDGDYRSHGMGLIVGISVFGATTLMNVVSNPIIKSIATATAGVMAVKTTDRLTGLIGRKMEEESTDKIVAKLISLPNVGNLTQYD